MAGPGGVEHGVAAHIRTQRLEAARSVLADPCRTETIHAVAARVGLPDPAHFSRLFTATYGLTPRDLQKQAAAHEPGPDPGTDSPGPGAIGAGRPAAGRPAGRPAGLTIRATDPTETAGALAASAGLPALATGAGTAAALTMGAAPGAHAALATLVNVEVQQAINGTILSIPAVAAC